MNFVRRATIGSTGCNSQTALKYLGKKRLKVFWGTHSPTHPPTHQRVHPPTNPSTHPMTHPPINLLTNPLPHLPIHHIPNTHSDKFQPPLTSPTIISYIRTPSPHQSTALVYDVSVRTYTSCQHNYSRPQSNNKASLQTSGARNSGVPQKVPVLQPYHMPSLQRPKSAILRYPSSSSKRLSSLRSLRQTNTLSYTTTIWTNITEWNHSRYRTIACSH